VLADELRGLQHGRPQQQQHPQIHRGMEDDREQQIPGQEEHEAEEQATHGN